ncbi:PREDICTED: arylacetamide deacetylase-like 3 [Crocodylus porosus]|uniref:arylacetamide deacetylase-like 3 n=1 Tax=Crocodylus porosus TaxID=8502 RepID=UPI00093A0DA8|nr:PREDICTED: arylacetamide deacetylase-like 3 [Crocodylus porosus]
MLALIIIALIILVVFLLQYEQPKAEIPHEVCGRVLLHIFHHIARVSFGLELILEKFGIYVDHHIIRLALNLVPSGDTSKLFVKDLTFEKINVRIYQPKVPSAGLRRGVVYCHGGTGRFGSIKVYDSFCCSVATKTESVVMCVGYRLAPEHPFPTQFDDCLAATIHFMRTAEDYGVDPTRLIVCGDSSGGTIAAAVCQALVNRTDLPRVRAQILIYPFLQAVDFNLPSYQQNHAMPPLLRKWTIYLGLRYLNIDVSAIDGLLEGIHIREDLREKYSKWLSPDNIQDEFKIRGYEPPKLLPCVEEYSTKAQGFLTPTFSPLLAEDDVICQLPECFILTCEHDVLRDDGLLYKKRLEDNGVEVTWCHLKDGFHGVLAIARMYRIISFEAGLRGIDTIAKFIRSL